MFIVGRENWGRGSDGPVSWAQRAPRPRALAQSPNLLRSTKTGGGGC